MKIIFPSHPAFIRLLFVLAAAASCLTGAARAADVVGSGHVIRETRNVSGFHGVELSSSGDVIVTQGDTEGLVIEAEDNILPLIESKVEGDGILHLGFKNHAGSVETHKGVIYRLAVKTLDKMVVEGSGSIRAESLTADHLSTALPGSGEVTVNHLKTETATTSIEGSGKVKLAGEAHRQSVSIDGSGEYQGTKLRTEDASVEINGSGAGEVWASGSLSVTINGSGEVGYHGSPTVKKSINGSGEVRALGAKDE